MESTAIEKMTPLEQEMMTVQTQNVIFEEELLSDWHKDLLAVMCDMLQKCQSGEAPLPRDPFGQMFVEIVCDEDGGENDKARVIKEAQDLMRMTVEYSWIRPKKRRYVHNVSLIVHTMQEPKDANIIYLNIATLAIPFLLYYTIGMGCARYKYLYPLEKFREDFKIPPKMRRDYITEHVLSPARMRLIEGGSNLWFDYEIRHLDPDTGRRIKYKKNNVIIFRIKSVQPEAEDAEPYTESFLYNWLKQAIGGVPNITVGTTVEG